MALTNTPPRWLKHRLGAGRSAWRATPLGVLALHALTVVLHAILFQNAYWMIPFLARRYFHAGDWQTAAVTTVLPASFLVSVLWSEVLRRVSLPRYLLIFWLVSALPLACMGLVQNFTQLFICHAFCSIGLAAWVPANGKLLKHLYSDAIRGRVFAILNVAQILAVITSAYFVSDWLDRDADAFREYLPLAAALHLVGIGLLIWLAKRMGASESPAPGQVALWRAAAAPLRHTMRVFRADRVFYRYEIAFMTYGAAFMFCDLLLVVLAEGKLGLAPGDYGKSTRLCQQLGTLLAIYPMGWTNDRFGAARVSSAAFAILALYPILLTLATGPAWIGAASVVFGLGLAGVSMGWMLGPVALARRVDDVAEYSAIHATMVGVRGLVFQPLGMVVYSLSGVFFVPFGLAALAFAAAAVQMWSLQSAIRQRRRDSAPSRPR